MTPELRLGWDLHLNQGWNPLVSHFNGWVVSKFGTVNFRGEFSSLFSLVNIYYIAIKYLQRKVAKETAFLLCFIFLGFTVLKPSKFTST